MICVWRRNTRMEQFVTTVVFAVFVQTESIHGHTGVFDVVLAESSFMTIIGTRSLASEKPTFCLSSLRLCRIWTGIRWFGNRRWVRRTINLKLVCWRQVFFWLRLEAYCRRSFSANGHTCPIDVVA